MSKLSKAATDVLAERERQRTVEGWSPEHDDEHDGGALAHAAGCYALGDKLRKSGSTGVPQHWPWEPQWFKPKDRRRDLVRAGALIIAEIERLDRAAGDA